MVSLYKRQDRHIMHPAINHYDIIEDKNSLGKKLFDEEIERIKHQNFSLKHNYLNINLQEFLSFDIVTYNNELVCFSGMQIRPAVFPTNTARVHSRFYFSEKYRRKTLSVFRDRLNNYEIPELAFPGFLVTLPYQIEKAKKMGLDAVFISREKINEFSGKSEKLRLDTFRKLHNGAYELKVLPKLYNMCGMPIDNKECWQYIFYTILNTNKTEILFESMKSITLDEWKFKYGKKSF